MGRPTVDMKGKVYGDLTAIAADGVMPGGGLRWRFSCSCGAEFLADGAAVRRGRIKSCGCAHDDLAGRTIGALTLLEPAEITSRGRSPRWRAECECGVEVEISRAELRRLQHPSCGCVPGWGAVDLRGRRFGLLLVVEPLPREGRQGVWWRCACECGNETKALAKDLLGGLRLSCGCRIRQRAPGDGVDRSRWAT